MTPFESNNKRFRIKPETGYTIASTEEQEGIILGLRAIADAATVSSEWIIWTIIGDGYTLRDHKVEIDRKLTWHQFIEIKLGLHGTDQCQVWVVPHGALDQWDSRTTSLMIGTALDATNGQIGFLEVPNMVANWTIPIMFTIPYSFSRYVLLVRPFLSSHDFLGHEPYMSSIRRSSLRIQWEMIPLGFIANVATLFLYNSASPLYDLSAMHAPDTITYFTAINEKSSPLMQLPPDSMRVYLCPQAIIQTDMNMLLGTCASFKNRLDHVLYKLIWYDWFSNRSIRSIIPEDDSYQLVITPGITRPWDAGRAEFSRRLRLSAIQIGRPLTTLTLDMTPNYIAHALSITMRAADHNHVIGGKSMTY
jgi:hypothetical protein